VLAAEEAAGCSETTLPALERLGLAPLGLVEDRLGPGLLCGRGGGNLAGLGLVVRELGLVPCGRQLEGLLTGPEHRVGHLLGLWMP